MLALLCRRRRVPYEQGDEDGLVDKVLAFWHAIQSQHRPLRHGTVCLQGQLLLAVSSEESRDQTNNSS